MRGAVRLLAGRRERGGEARDLRVPQARVDVGHHEHALALHPRDGLGHAGAFGEVFGVRVVEGNLVPAVPVDAERDVAEGGKRHRGGVRDLRGRVAGVHPEADVDDAAVEVGARGERAFRRPLLFRGPGAVALGGAPPVAGEGGRLHREVGRVRRAGASRVGTGVGDAQVEIDRAELLRLRAAVERRELQARVAQQEGERLHGHAATRVVHPAAGRVVRHEASAPVADWEEGGCRAGTHHARDDGVLRLGEPPPRTAVRDGETPLGGVALRRERDGRADIDRAVFICRRESLPVEAKRIGEAFHRAFRAGRQVVERTGVRGTAVAPEGQRPEAGRARGCVSERGGLVAETVLDAEAAEAVRGRVEGDADAASLQYRGAGRRRERFGRHPGASVAPHRHGVSRLERLHESGGVARRTEVELRGPHKRLDLPAAASRDEIVDELI